MYSRWSPLNISPKTFLEYFWECDVSWNLMSHMSFCIVHSCCFDVGTKFSTSRVAFSSRNSFKTGTSELGMAKKKKKIFSSRFYVPKCIFYLLCWSCETFIGCWLLPTTAAVFKIEFPLKVFATRSWDIALFCGKTRTVCIDTKMVRLKKKKN